MSFTWDDKLRKEKEDEFIKERIEKRNDSQIYESCCKTTDTKLIFAHGYIEPTNNFELLDGYKVIILATYGESICFNLTFINKLKQVYKQGKSIFKDNDRNPLEYTSEGEQLCADLNFMSNFRLFIGGTHNICDNTIKTYIPNVSLRFGGDNCDNWGYQTDPTKIDYGCYIQCINDENKNEPDKLSRCEKYFFSSNLTESDYRNTKNSKGIFLEDLLTNEGKGTYILLSCLSYGRNLTSDEKQRYASMVQASHSPHGSVAKRTRANICDIKKAQKTFEDSNANARGFKTKKKQYKRKTKSRKLKAKTAHKRKRKHKKRKSSA